MIRRGCMALSTAALLVFAGSAVAEEPVFTDKGKASFYHDKFEGRKTANGERFDQDADTAAHKSLPLGTVATVKNLETGESTQVEVNDRGPFVDGRVIDLTKQAAEDVGLEKKEGLAPVVVEAKPSDQPTQELKEKVEEAAAKDAKKDGRPAGDPGSQP